MKNYNVAGTEKQLRVKYLRQLIDPDKQSVPIDRNFKGFSFVGRSILSTKNKKKSSKKEKVFSMSPKSKQIFNKI